MMSSRGFDFWPRGGAIFLGAKTTCDRVPSIAEKNIIFMHVWIETEIYLKIVHVQKHLKKYFMLFIDRFWFNVFTT